MTFDKICIYHINNFQFIYYRVRKRFNKATIQNYQGLKKYVWAIRMFLIAISLSLFFGFISQTLLNNMGIIVASICISIFIFLSVLFDMIGIAAASADIEFFINLEKKNEKGATTGIKLCKHSEKVCSFCADVVGDICSTLCGAGGACIVVALTNQIANSQTVILISISVSALIAGISILFKDIMKERAMCRSNKIILNIAIILYTFL